mgnify:CR=1 FL=1
MGIEVQFDAHSESVGNRVRMLDEQDVLTRTGDGEYAIKDRGREIL